MHLTGESPERTWFNDLKDVAEHVIKKTKSLVTPVQHWSEPKSLHLANDLTDDGS